MPSLQRPRTLFTALSLFLLTGGVLTCARITSGQTQAEMNRDAIKQHQNADAEMNAAYKRLMGILKKEQRAQLKTAQLAWLKFRDAEAPLLASKVKGGTVYPTIYHMHLAEITVTRTKSLKDAYKLFTTDGEM